MIGARLSSFIFLMSSDDLLPSFPSWSPPHEEENLGAQIKDMAAFLVQVQSSLKQIGQHVSRFEEEYSQIPAVSLSELPPETGISLPERLEDVISRFLEVFRELQRGALEREKQFDEISALLGISPDADVVKTIRDLRNERDSLLIRNKDSDRLQGDVDEQLRAKDKRIQELETSLATRHESSEVRSLRQKVDALSSELNQATADISHERLAASRAQTRHEQEIRDLKSEFEKSRVVTGIPDEIPSISDQYKQLQKEKELLERERDNLEAEFRERLASQAAEHREELEKLQRDLQSAVTGDGDVSEALQEVVKAIDKLTAGEQIASVRQKSQTRPGVRRQPATTNPRFGFPLEYAAPVTLVLIIVLYELFN
jgi:DNA repair exonuclease SbcCD ATPase subunit